MKKVRAVRPYIYTNCLNFKNKPYEAWKALGGETVDSWYPRWLHGLMFKLDLPTLWHGEARLCFVQPVSLYFDTFFSVLTHEIVPFVWDCWPRFYEKVEVWLKRHKVKTAIFTCKETCKHFRNKIPSLNVIYCYEGIDSVSYSKGNKLECRSVDILEFGRGASDLIEWNLPSSIYHVCTNVNGKYLFTDDVLHGVMADSKVTVCFPQSITNVAKSGGVETLTQRYWECMLSRIVIVGHCPQELIDILRYNPVVELELSDNTKYKQDQIIHILQNINDYQCLVDKNYYESIKYCDWKNRISYLQNELKQYGYNI